jgi:hypothetical protein
MRSQFEYSLLGIIILGAVQAYGADFYVASSGSIANPGTFPEPFLTIQQAANVAVAGDTVYLRAGTYRETVTPVNDGTEADPIVFRPYQDEMVVISGSDLLSGWTDSGGGVWEAAMNWSMAEHRNQLFVNGTGMTKARWPNVADDDLLTPEGAIFDRANSNMMQARPSGGFPLSWTATTLDGAAVWVMADKKWRAWNSAVTGYDPGSGIVSFEEVTQTWYAGNMNPENQGPYGDGYFYLSGSRGLLDASGEWWRDVSNDKMLLIPPAGVSLSDPGTMIEAKRRDLGFDLDNRAYIYVVDLFFRGTSASLDGSENCRLTRLKFHDFDYREGATHHSLGPFYSSNGLLISGEGNVVRDSEFARCTDGGVTILGEDNALINCYLHEVDYGGYDGGPINLGGRRNLVSHNTVERTSRKGINPSGLSHLIQYNLVKETGLVTRDQASIYAGGSNPGGNTVIRYNWVNVGNGNPESHSSGIYLDNWHKDIVIHHNIVWNVTNGTGLQPNRPGHYDLWVHNTVEGKISTNYGPWQGQETLYGTFLHNNWSTGSIDAGDYVWSKIGNRQAPLNLGFDSGIPVPNGDISGRNSGSFLPGINDGYVGSAPDIGAIENGVLDWAAGHNFANPPNPAYEPAAFYYRNYVVNGGFDFQRVNYTPKLDRFHGWTQTGLAAGAVEFHSGFNFPTAEQRNSLHSNSVHLQGTADDGVEQTITNLPAGRFEFAAYVRLVTPEPPGGDVRLSMFRDGQEVAAEVATSVSLSGSQAWRLVKVPFTQHAAGDITVRISKLGDGDAYVDNIGFVPNYFDDPFDIPSLPESDLPIQNGLLLHLDASKIYGHANGEALDSWIDQTGSGNDGAATGAERPVFIENGLNGKPIVRFDGVDDWLDVGTLRDSTGAMDCFLVALSTDTNDGNWQRFIACYDTGNDDFQAPNWSALRPQNSGSPIAFEPMLVKISYSSARHIANLKIARHGKNNWGFYGGDIAEVALFDRQLSDMEQNAVGFHLQQKYNLTGENYTDPSVQPEIVVEHSGQDLVDGAAALRFPDLLTGGAVSSHLALTVRNTGTAALTGLAASFDGVNAVEFSVGSFGSTTLSPGESASLTITFTPVAVGSKSADLHIASNDSNENPFDIALSGDLIESTTLESWAGSFGLTGDAAQPHADDDGDLVSLFDEYAFHLDPTINDERGLTPGTGTSGLPLMRLLGNRLQIEFLRRRSDSNLVYSPQFGGTLPDGFAAGVEAETVTIVDSNFERVIINDSESTATAVSRFARVFANQAPDISLFFQTVELQGQAGVEQYVLYATAQDPDGDSLSYDFTILSGGGALVGEDAVNGRVIYEEDTPGDKTLRVTVNDDRGGIAVRDLVFTIPEPPSSFYLDEQAWETALNGAPATGAYAFVANNPALPNVLLIGDSISIGYTTHVRTELAAEANVYRIPQNGGSSHTGKTKMAIWLAGMSWAVVHYNSGLHDLKYVKDGVLTLPENGGVQVVPIAEYETNLGDVFTIVENSGLVDSLVWATTTPVPDGAEGRIAGDEVDYNGAADNVLMSHRNVQKNDIWTLMNVHQEEQHAANVHYTTAGSQRMSTQVAATIRALLPVTP